MKKYSFLFIIVIGLLTWHFVSISTVKDIPHLSVSVNSSIAFAQSEPTLNDNGWLTKMLSQSNAAAGSSLSWFDTIYSFSRGLLNIIMLAFLVYVAIRNILNISVESYAIKKILPKLIFAAFLGNLIKPIMAVGSSIVDSVINSQTTIFHTPATWSWYGAIAGNGFTLFNNTIAPGAWGLLAVLFGPALAGNVGIIMLLIGVITNVLLLGGMFVIAVFQAIRPWIVLLATAAGPIAIGLSILPETEGIFKKWYKIILFWLFMPLILNALSYIIGLIPSMRGNYGVGFMSSVVGTLLPLVLKIGLYGLAVRMPFTWEKDVGGMIAALPSTVTNTAKKTLAGADKVNKAVGGEIVLQGRKWENKLRQDTRRKAHDGSFGMAQGIATNNYNTPNEADERMITQYETVNHLEYLSKPENQAEARSIFGDKPPTQQTMAAMYEKWNAGTLNPGDAKEAAAIAYFGDDHSRAKVENKSRDDFIKDRTEKIQTRAANSAESQLQAGRGPHGGAFNVFRGVQQYSLAGISNALAARNEFREGEIKKAAFRFDVVAKAVAGKEVDVKSQNVRKDSDFAQLYSSDQVNAEASNSREKAARIFQARMAAESGMVVSIQQARAALEAELERLDRAAESTYVYNSSLLGKSANGETIDSNDLGTLIAGHNRTKTLAASEARSTKSVDEQQFIREQRIHAAYSGSSGPSPNISGRTGRAQTEAATEATQRRDELSRGDILLNNTMLRMDRRLARTSNGITAINGSKQQLSGVDFSGVTNDEFARFSVGSEEGLMELGRLLTTKKDQPTADRFVSDLRTSRGLDNPTMIQRAKSEFGDDPQVEEQIVNYGIRQQVELDVIQKSQNVQTLRVVAGQLAQKQAVDTGIAQEIKRSLETFVKSETGDRSISPEQALAARKYIAAQSGISDPNGINLGMVQNLAAAHQVTSYTNPEVE